MLILLVLCTVVTIISSLNVLVWNPIISHSHVRFLGNIADVLHDSGHNVTIFSPVMDPHANLVGHTKPIFQIPYYSKYLNNSGFDDYDMGSPAFWTSPMVEGRSISIEDIKRYHENALLMCKALIEDHELLDRLRNSRFDVALHELYELSAVAFLELIGVKKAIVVSAAGMTLHMKEITGMPPNPSFVPGIFTTYNDEMTFWERLDNFKCEIELNYRFLQWEEKLRQLFNKASPGFPDLRKLLKQKIGVILVNANEFTETPRPRGNIVRYIGGMAIPEPKPLNQELSAVLDKRSTNVLFSMGSLAKSSTMPLHLKKDILNAFAAFPNTTFVFKYDGKDDLELFKPYPNVHVMKWVPQVDLLGDKRLSLFVTHAGLNSITEATYFGKPMITIPLFADQFINAKNLRRIGLAVLIERNNLNKDTLITALCEVLSPDAKYAHKASTVARYLRGLPSAARAEVTRWVELVAEEGQMEHLMMKARDLSFIQYYCLDIIGYLLAQIVIVLCVMFLLMRYLSRRITLVFQKKKIE
uniref:glucuronosyltransferase n=1 Tax=Haemonchus contortus TaxID=6289 RepID=A0A7I4Y3N1_HAECO